MLPLIAASVDEPTVVGGAVVDALVGNVALVVAGAVDETLLGEVAGLVEGTVR